MAFFVSEEVNTVFDGITVDALEKFLHRELWRKNLAERIYGEKISPDDMWEDNKKYAVI